MLLNIVKLIQFLWMLTNTVNRFKKTNKFLNETYTRNGFTLIKKQKKFLQY